MDEQNKQDNIGLLDTLQSEQTNISETTETQSEQTIGLVDMPAEQIVAHNEENAVTDADSQQNPADSVTNENVPIQTESEPPSENINETAATEESADIAKEQKAKNKEKQKKEKHKKEKVIKEKKSGGFLFFRKREKFSGGSDEPYIDPNDSGELSTLEVRHLVKKFGLKTAVNDASFSMKQGETVGLLGPNGAGKTTIFYMIVGFIKPTKGDILLDHHTITYMQMYKRARLGICYLAQEASVFRKLTVEENIDAVLESLKIPNSEKRRRKEETMTDLGITRLARQKAYSLSGGERRRTEIARALVLKPKFLLLDEPFAGVDPIAVADIQNIIYGLREKNIGVLITDHNVRETLRITNRAYIINLGNIFRAGSADELVNDPMVRKVYLGENFDF